MIHVPARLSDTVTYVGGRKGRPYGTGESPGDTTYRMASIGDSFDARTAG
jgi:hypothetical protein